MIRTLGLEAYSEIEYPDIRIPFGTTLLQGPSGSGKTTLFRLFNATVTPTAGEVHYLGQPIDRADPVKLRQKILLQGQNPYLFPGTITDNFEAYHRYRKTSAPPPAEIRALLDTCQLDLPADYPAAQLSGGETSRVFLAIMLSMQPEVLLADEPTAALDEPTAARVLEALAGHCADHEIALVLISHHPQLAKQWAQQVVTLS